MYSIFFTIIVRSQVTARNIKLPPPNPGGPLLVRKSHYDEIHLASRRTPPLPPHTKSDRKHRTNQTKPNQNKNSIQYPPPPQMERAPNPPPPHHSAEQRVTSSAKIDQEWGAKRKGDERRLRAWRGWGRRWGGRARPGACRRPASCLPEASGTFAS